MYNIVSIVIIFIFPKRAQNMSFLIKFDCICDVLWGRVREKGGAISIVNESAVHANQVTPFISAQTVRVSFMI